MTNAGNILRRSTKIHSCGSLTNEITSSRPYNMHTEHCITLGIRQQLHLTCDVINSSCPAIRSKWKNALLVSYAVGFQLVFSPSNSSNFWVCKNDSWNETIINMTPPRLHRLNTRDAIFFSFVREHWPRNTISDCIHT